MRVRFLLNLASGVSLGLTIVLGVALILSFFAINTTSSNLLLARSIRTTILERIFLRDEFYARREDRPGRQFILKSGLLASQLDEAGALFRDPRDRAIIAEVKASLDKTLAIFQKLVDDDSRNGADSEYGKMLFSQLLAKGYILNDDAARLELRSMATLASLNRNLLFLILACLAIVVALILVNNILIGRTLGMGIRRLQDGAASVGGGNLKFRFELRSDDEIADVEQSINTMAESLHASFSAVQVLELEAKRRALELAVSNSELEAFAYSVAHDLRAPLRSISGFASVLEEELGPSVSGEAVRILGIIRENAGKMNILISELLDITRLGRTALNLSRVNMEAVATEALSTVAGPDTAGDFDILVGVLPEVDADSAMIARVWANLLSNAIKYSLPSPVHAIEIGGYANEGMTTYFIKDRGVGFDQRYAGKLFGMFERLHDQKDFSGNGVGLAIVKRIVARHGGRVWAEGEVGAGATFYFSLPSPADAAGPA
ncbi:MAG: sensor histidine kinase [Rectinemataceae bacterium]